MTDGDGVEESIRLELRYLKWEEKRDIFRMEEEEEEEEWEGED